MATPDELFKSITGYDYVEKKALLDLQENFKMKPHLVDKPGVESTYNFNKAWEQSKAMEEQLEGLVVEAVVA